MSVSRVKYSKQFFSVSTVSFDSGTGTVTVTANSHGLFTGIPVALTSDTNYSVINGNATVTSANTFTIASYVNPQFVTHFSINGFLTIGEKGAQTLPRATGTETIVQSYVNGAGGASYKLDVSLDKEHWITLNTITHASVSGNTSYATISPGWAYYRANVASIGANTNLVIMSGE